MNNIVRADSMLDKLLDQSLSAVAKTVEPAGCVVAHLHALLARLAAFFRMAKATLSEAVLEPGCVRIEVRGNVVLAPRLAIQCRRSYESFDEPLTLLYVPTSATHVELRVAARGVVRTAATGISWTGERGWCFPSLGSDVSCEAHTQFLRVAFCDVGLFSKDTLALEVV